MQVTVSGWCGPLQSDLAASWVEALGTNVGWLVAAVASIYVWKTWRSTRAQLGEARQQTVHARQQAQAARDQLRLEKSRDRQLRLAQLREQADQVAAWMVKAPFESIPTAEVRVVNQSAQPVYQFQVRFLAGDQLWGRPEHPLQMGQAMLAPAVGSQGVSFAIGLDPADIQRFDAAQANDLPFGVCFTFTDIHGQAWTRRWNGELVPGRDRFTDTDEALAINSEAVRADG